MGYFLFMWRWFMDLNHAIAGLQVRQQVDFESVSVSESLRFTRRVTPEGIHRGSF